LFGNILIFILIFFFYLLISAIAATADNFPEGARVVLDLSLEGVHKACLINVLGLFFEIYSLCLECTLHPKLELLAAYIEKLIENWTFHLKKLE